MQFMILYNPDDSDLLSLVGWFLLRVLSDGSDFNDFTWRVYIALKDYCLKIITLGPHLLARLAEHVYYIPGERKKCQCQGLSIWWRMISIWHSDKYSSLTDWQLSAWMVLLKGIYYVTKANRQYRAPPEGVVSKDLNKLLNLPCLYLIGFSGSIQWHKRLFLDLIVRDLL